MNGKELGWVVRRTPREFLFTVHDPRIEPEPNTGCWLWMSAVTPRGYGVATIGTAHTGRAHRLVWTRLRGPIPCGMVLDHICRVRLCVNPDHLRVVTPAQNVTENSLSPTALRARRTQCDKCGGPFSRLPYRKHRVCIPCTRAYEKIQNDKWNPIRAARKQLNRHAQRKGEA